MSDLSLQRKLAAEILKVGRTRVWMDTEHLEEIKKAITRSSIKKMISHGYIKAKRAKIKIPELHPKRRTRGEGSRKGRKGSRLRKKRRWINTVRPLRNMLKELRDEKKIERKEYRRLYSLVKSGMFRSRAHLRLYLRQRGIVHENRT